MSVPVETTRAASPNMAVDIAGVRFNNPVLLASGTCAFGRELSEFMDLSGLGGICVKGLTLQPRHGNAPPRVADTPSGMLNSIGLQNPGVEYFIKHELPFLRSINTRIIANVAGGTIEEYERIAGILSETDIDMLEMNISCPNVKAGGVAFGTDASVVREITSRVRKCCKKPLIVKLSPNVTDIAAMAKSAEDGGADALSMINTLIGMRIDINTRRPVLANNIGGLSGPCIRPVAVRMVWQAARAVKIPIIGMGGVESYEDAVQFMLAGARAVAIGTASLVNPTAAESVRDGLSAYLTRAGIGDINELVGAVLPNEL